MTPFCYCLISTSINMAPSSSREARSARREALKSKLAAHNIGTTRKNCSGKVTKNTSAPKSKSQGAKEVEKALSKQAQPEHNQEEPKVESVEESKEESIEEPKVESIDNFKAESKEESTEELVQEPKEASKEEPKETPELNITDPEQDAYVQDFEETSFGNYPEPAEIPLPAPQSPKRSAPRLDFSNLEIYPEFPSTEVPSLESPDTPISSPLLSPSTPNDDVEQDECDIEDYINCDNESETSAPTDTKNNMNIDLIHTAGRTRRALMCFSGTKPLHHPFHSSFNPNKRTLMAAWRTMAPDYLAGPREAYIHSVLLAAASLNQRSMLSGGARQTMSPGMNTY